jgi:arsenate reductase
MVPRIPKILFICTGNSCRSQMAEGWTRHLKKDLLQPSSAGIEKHGLDPLAVKVMDEAGVDISKQTSKLINELKDKESDYVVTICEDANRNCPVFPGKAKRIHHAFDNPPRIAKTLTSREEILSLYRRVRDEIKEFINKMPDNL